MKLIKALVVMLVAVGMILPAVAVAEDRLTLSGEMRVRGWHNDSDGDFDADYSIVEGPSGRFSFKPGKDDTQSWADQRLRIAGKIAVAEGVSITFRTDITEKDWGNSDDPKESPIQGNGAGSGRSGAGQQWDRAHLDITKGMFHLRAGQQFVGTFGTNAVDTQDNGLVLDVATGAPIKTWFIVDNDNGGKSDADAFLYGAMVAPKGDNWSAKIFASGYKGNGNVEYDPADPDTDVDDVLGVATAQDADVYVIGASGSMDLAGVKLFGEVDFFGGEYNKDVDAMGTQLHLDASMAATDAITVGGQFFYAAGDDEDVQYTYLGNGFNGWDPIYDNGTQLSNEAIDLFDRPFNWAMTGTLSALGTGLLSDFDEDLSFPGALPGAGVIGGRLYASTMFADATFGASVAYLTTEEDKVVEADCVAASVGMVYPVMENVTFQAQLQYATINVDSAEFFEDYIIGASQEGLTEFPELDRLDIDGDIDSFTAGAGLFVKF